MPGNMIRNLSLEESPRALFSLLLIFSLLIKIVLIYQAAIVNPDGIRYVNSAHELFQGNVAAALTHEKMLGFSFLLGLTHLVVPDWFLAGKILSCTALLLSTIPLYLIAHELFGRRAAFYTALVFTVAPTINGKCAAIIKDPPFLLLTLLSLWLVILTLRESNWRYSLAAGLFCSLSALVRPEGVVCFLIFAVFWVVSTVLHPERRKSHLKCLAAFTGLPLGVLTLSIIPLVMGMIAPKAILGIIGKIAQYFQADFTRSYMAIYQHLKAVEGNFPGGEWTNDFFEYARKNIFLIYLIGMIQTFINSLFPVFVLPLFLGLKLKQHWNRKLVLFLSVTVVFLFMDYVFLLSRNFLAGRYLLVPVVLSFVLVGYGLDRLDMAIQSYSSRKLLFSVLVILCVILPLSEPFIEISGKSTEIRDAGEWLQNYSKTRKKRMIVNEERVAFYAGLFRSDYETFKDDRMAQLESKALRSDSEIIVIYRYKTEVESIPAFDGFALLESFSGPKKVVMVYERKT